MAFGAILSAVAPSLISAGAGLLGSSQSKSDHNKAAGQAAFQPFDVRGPSGSANITFDRKNPARNKINLNLSPQMQQLYSGLLSGAGGSLGAYPGALDPLSGAVGLESAALGGSALPGLFSEIMGSSNFLEGAGRNRLLDLNQAGSLLRQGGIENLNAMNQAPSAGGLSTFAAETGAGLLGTPQARSFNDISAERLRMLREGARPQEDRAVNAKFQQLFNTGRLGTTGGQRGLGELALAQEQADIGRQVSAMDFAEGLRGREMQDIIQRLQIGQGLLGQGLTGVGMDQQMARGRGQIGAGLLQGLPDVAISGLKGAAGLDEANLSRGMQRLKAATGLFGFGETAASAPLQRALSLLSGSQTIDEQLRAQAGLGLEGGGRAASAGANVASTMAKGAGSPFATALQNFSESGGVDDIFGAFGFGE